jgi:uncharacterized membrane protein YbhN (UPF0104 family)
MQPAAVHFLCVVCLLVDGAARAWRLRILVRALGGSVAFRAALGANLVEDAAAALTPWRLGGIPARIAILRRDGVGTGTALVVGIAESTLTYPLVILNAVWVIVAFAPDWRRTIGPQVARSTVSAGTWLALALVLGLVVWLILRRLLPRHHDSARRTLLTAWREARRAGPLVLGWSVFLTFASMAARVAILPILTRTLVPSPPLEAVTLSSFALLYGQLLLPTPSGAGAVELGFLSGGAGAVGAIATRLLLAWRFYTALVAIGSGVLVAFVHAVHALRSRRPTGELSPNPSGGPHA